MSLTGKILLYIMTSFCVATAQVFLSLYAKGLSSPFSFPRWIVYSLSNHFFYGGLLLYGISFVMFILLLRLFPIAQVTLTILTLVIAITFIYNYMYGQALSPIQYLGALMATGGLIALNWEM